MKKYIVPKVRTVKVNGNKILAGSVESHNELGDGNQLVKPNKIWEFMDE